MIIIIECPQLYVCAQFILLAESIPKYNYKGQTGFCVNWLSANKEMFAQSIHGE